MVKMWKPCRRKVLESNIRLSQKIIYLYESEKRGLSDLEEKGRIKEEAYSKGKAYAFAEVLKMIGD